MARRARWMAAGRSTRPGVPRFQFTLSQLIVVTAVMAVFYAAAFAVPAWASLILAYCFTLLLPMVFTVGLIYGRGYLRTFCIGALFPAGALGLNSLRLLEIVHMIRHFGWFEFYPRIDDESRAWAWIFLLGVCGVSAIFGQGAMGVRWLLESRQRRNARDAAQPPPDVFADE